MPKQLLLCDVTLLVVNGPKECVSLCGSRELRARTGRRKKTIKLDFFFLFIFLGFFSPSLWYFRKSLQCLHTRRVLFPHCCQTLPLSMPKRMYILLGQRKIYASVLYQNRHIMRCVVVTIV